METQHMMSAKYGFKLRSLDMLCVVSNDVKYVARCQILALLGKTKCYGARINNECGVRSVTAEELWVASPMIDRRTLFIPLEVGFRLLVDNIPNILKGKKTTYASHIVKIINETKSVLKITRYAAGLPKIEVEIPAVIQKLAPIRIYIPKTREGEISHIVRNVSHDVDTDLSESELSESDIDESSEDEIDSPVDLNAVEPPTATKRRRTNTQSAPREQTPEPRVAAIRKISLKSSMLNPLVEQPAEQPPSEQTSTADVATNLDTETTKRLDILHQLIAKQEKCIKLQREFYEVAIERRSLLDSLMIDK
jgi:hypothetical protein